MLNRALNIPGFLRCVPEKKKEWLIVLFNNITRDLLC